MIVDKIKNWDIYFNSPVFKKIYEELQDYNIDSSDGTYRSNENYYFKVMSYDTKLDSDIIESHKKEVDVQILLSGNEHIKVYDFNEVNIIKPYDELSDCQFYKKNGPAVSTIDLRPGYMAIFFPDDIHHPQFAVNNKIETLKKIVIKIDEKLFTR